MRLIFEFLQSKLRAKVCGAAEAWPLRLQKVVEVLMLNPRVRAYVLHECDAQVLKMIACQVRDPL